MTFREQVLSKLRKGAKEQRGLYLGNDWWQITPEDLFVFEIDEARWPHMLVAWCAYEVLLGTVDPEDHGYQPSDLPVEQEMQAALIAQGPCIGTFQAFAKDFASLTFREAAATYDKMTYWNVRGGTISYSDETIESSRPGNE